MTMGVGSALADAELTIRTLKPRPPRRTLEELHDEFKTVRPTIGMQFDHTF